MNESKQIIPELYDEEALLLPPKKVFELQMGARRLYYEYIETPQGEVPKFYIGVTSMLQAVLPTSPYLIEWKVKLGEKEAERVLTERSGYGSFMHGLYSELLINKEFDLDSCESRAEQYLLKNDLRADLKDEWTEEVKKDILAFAQWIKDYDAKPILIEGAMTSAMGFAGRVDFFGFITIEKTGYFGELYKTGDKKGEPKLSKAEEMVLAVVDFKSGKGGNFYLSHELQLMCYKQLVAENFPQALIKIGLPVSIYNFSPTDWKTEPKYKFVCQDGKHLAEELDAYVDLFHMTNNFTSQRLLNISGKVSLDRYESITECYNSLSLADIVSPKTERTPSLKDKVTETDAPTNALFLDI